MRSDRLQPAAGRERIGITVSDCSLGSVLVAQSERGVCAVLLGDAPDSLVSDLRKRFPRAEIQGGDQSSEALVSAVVRAVETPHETAFVDVPLDLRGTAFQQRVWRALREVPPGTTTTYARLAKAIGAPEAVRAVGAAVGANPIAVAIPCHRVIRTDGALGGYRWGVERKRALMTREAGLLEAAISRD